MEKPMTTLFNAIQNNVTVATQDTVRTPMTAQAVKELRKKLFDIMALNVYPNQFDSKKPYRVATRWDGEFTNHGNFSDLEVAKMVGNIASLALFQGKAQASYIIDMEATQEHPEMKAWLVDVRNQEVIGQAEAVYA